jgi:hypothetical protein
VRSEKKKEERENGNQIGRQGLQILLNNKQLFSKKRKKLILEKVYQTNTTLDLF